jgi:hypothetical protein
MKLNLYIFSGVAHNARATRSTLTKSLTFMCAGTKSELLSTRAIRSRAVLINAVRAFRPETTAVLHERCVADPAHATLLLHA